MPLRGCRDPRHDPQPGDVLRDPDGFYIYVSTRTPRLVFTQPFGDKKPMIWCLCWKLGYWRRLAKDAEVIMQLSF